MAELTVDTPSPDDVSYEWRREFLAEQGVEMPAGPASPVITGTLLDRHGRTIQVGATGGNVIVSIPAGRCTLPPDRAEDFAQAYNAASWIAAAQWGLEAAGGTCPADCGGQDHDQACRGTDG